MTKYAESGRECPSYPGNTPSRRLGEDRHPFALRGGGQSETREAQAAQGWAGTGTTQDTPTPHLQTFADFYKFQRMLEVGLGASLRSPWDVRVKFGPSQRAGGDAAPCRRLPPPAPTAPAPLRTRLPPFGWHYLSKATRLMRPRLFHALLVVSRTTITCDVIRHF